MIDPTRNHPSPFSRRQFHGRGGLLAGSALLAASGAIKAQPALGQSSGSSGGTLRLAQVGDPRFFNPGRQLDYWSWGGVYDSLLRYDQELNLQPHLAESHTVSEDGKTVTVRLRPGATFHSGRPVTSADLAFIIEKLKEPATGGIFRAFAELVTAVETPDAQTAIMILAKPEAGILDLLGNFYVPDPEAYDQLDQRAAGTGPFVFEEFVPGERVVLKRNENYWGQKALLDDIAVRILGDQQTAAANLESGDVDIALVTLQDFARLSEGDDYTMMPVVGAGMFSLLLNSSRPPFDNKLVRQAIAFAVDRARFNETILLGLSAPTNNPFPNYHWAYFPELDGAYPFDLERAKALLTEAGFPDGFEATANANSGNREMVGLAQILQSDLAKIGVKMTIDVKDPPRWSEATERGEFDINMMHYVRTTADPSLLFRGTTAWRPDTNPMGFSDPAYTELIDAQSAVIDREQRLPLLKNLIEYVQDQCFVVPVAPSVLPYAVSKQVQGFQILPVGPVAYMEQVSFT